MSRSLSHDSAGDSPRHSPSPYEQLQACLEDLEQYSHKAMMQFPKFERFLLCAQIRSSILQITRLSVVAWKRYHKKTTLQDLDVEIEVLRKWVTKSLRLGYINPDKHGNWLQIINTVGRMIGGWIKSERR